MVRKQNKGEKMNERLGSLKLALSQYAATAEHLNQQLRSLDKQSATTQDELRICQIQIDNLREEIAKEKANESMPIRWIVSEVTEYEGHIRDVAQFSEWVTCCMFLRRLPTNYLRQCVVRERFDNGICEWREDYKNSILKDMGFVQ